MATPTQTFYKFSPEWPLCCCRSCPLASSWFQTSELCKVWLHLYPKIMSIMVYYSILQTSEFWLPLYVSIMVHYSTLQTSELCKKCDYPWCKDHVHHSILQMSELCIIWLQHTTNTSHHAKVQTTDLCPLQVCRFSVRVPEVQPPPWPERQRNSYIFHACIIFLWCKRTSSLLK